MTKCFTFISFAAARSALQCGICLDEINLAALSNKYPYCVVKGKEAEEAALLHIKSGQEIIVTPCAHIFHRACIETWI